MVLTHLCGNGIGSYWWNVILVRVDSSNDVLAKIDPVDLRYPIGEMIKTMVVLHSHLKIALQDHADYLIDTPFAGDISGRCSMQRP